MCILTKSFLSERRGSCDAFIQDQAKKKSGILGAILVYIGPFVQNEKINNQFFKTTTQICSKNEQQTKGKVTERSESLFPGKLMKEQSFCFVFRELPLSLLETVHELFRKSFQKFGK